MSTLQGRSPKDSFNELLKLSSGSLNATLKTIEDGLGNATPLQLSNSTISLNGISWPTTGAEADKVLRVAAGGTTMEWVTLPVTTPEDCSIYRTNKDANNVYTTIEYKRPNGTLFKSSILSGGTSPSYTTRTVTYYATDGTTVTSTQVFTLTYADGDVVSEVLQ